jgi:hypothetical protein
VQVRDHERLEQQARTGVESSVVEDSVRGVRLEPDAE